MSFAAVDIIPLPGQLTDQQEPVRPDGTAAVNLREIVALGYEWISYQLVNGQTVNPIDIHRAAGAGFRSIGCWGVVYDQADFHGFGHRLAEEAARQKADHVIVDAEMCAKGTRAGRGMLPLIVGAREGGWFGPVHLTPLGAPVNAKPHGPNDFDVDVDSFLMTGGGVLPQAYYNAFPEYRPDLCCDYWTSVGVPRNRLNVMIELAFEQSKITGADWAKLLDVARVTRNYSVFMIQHGTDADWRGLLPHSRPAPPPAPTPVPPPPKEPIMEPVTSQQARAAVCFDVQAWEQMQTVASPRARLTLSRRICQPDMTDDKWNSICEQVRKLVDSTEVPK